jgi:quinol monooxygenase YgiN
MRLKKRRARMIDIIATQRVNAGMEKVFEALTGELTANTLSRDSGCLRYEWYRADAPQTYILFERWADKAAAQAHLSSDHLAALMPRLRDCVPEKFTFMRLARIE